MLSWLGSQEPECKVILENNNNKIFEFGKKNIVMGCRRSKVHAS